MCYAKGEQTVAEKREQYLSVRVTAAQREQLRKGAASRGMTVSDYVLERLFGGSSSPSEKLSNKALERKLDALIRGLIANHRLVALAAGPHLMGITPEDKEEISQFRDEQYQSLLDILGDEGKVKV